jgi:signal transduction histidine kinase
LDVTATPILDEEKRVVYAVAVFQDITAKKRVNQELERRVASRTRELEKALRAKSAFLMNVSHELRTPLNHVIGFTELLAERVEDPRSRKLAVTARNSGVHLLGKIDELIELARVESGSVDHDLVSFDFDSLLNEVAGEANVSHEHEAVGVVRSDPRIVSAALRVLLDHAGGAPLSADYDQGKVRVTIESAALARRVREDAHIGLAVARARLRAIGGDVIAMRGDRVELLLPRLEEMNGVRNHKDS